MLTTEDIERYHREGYIVPRDYRLPPEVLAQAREDYLSLLAANDGVASDIMLGPHLNKAGAQGIKGSATWLALASRPEIIDMAAQLIGPDIILWGTTVFGKPAHSGKATPWHQDGDYYPIRPLEVLTIWMALDDATPENGCMRFIPGSHRQRTLFSHHWKEGTDLTINLTCDQAHFDETTAVDLALQAGQISFHDVYMIHESGPNRTDHRRAAFVVRLMPATSFYDHVLGAVMGKQHPAQDYGGRALFLLRGADKSGRNNFSIGH
ncbi:MAG: phytanoyl-CoA dioxygenase family protein [Pseudomonadota bacterium]